MPHRLEQQPQEHERLKRNHIANEGGQQVKHEPRTTRRGPRRAHRRRPAPWTSQSALIGSLGAPRQARRC